MSNPARLNGLFFAVLAAGIAARLLVATFGHDFDMDSWQIVARLTAQGQNVYANTPRYNFAPGWFIILHGLYLLAGRNEVVFRYFVAGFLSAADAGIFFILWRKFGKIAGCWFFLNPISIIISGYQNNFDNLAILTGLMAALLIGDEFEKPVNRRTLLGLLVLGFSLVLKHVFFAFPFWLAVKQKGFGQKLIVVLVPVLIFLLSFVPWWHEGKQGIIQNVFQYGSFTREYFYSMFVPAFVQFMFSSRAIWLGLLVLFAFICRRKSVMETMLLYTGVLVATCPGTLNEYLAIPLAFVATHLNVLTILYIAVGTLHLLVDFNGFHLTAISPTIYIDIAIDVLCLAVAWATWPQAIAGAIKKLFAWAVLEVENQLGLKK